MNDETELWIEVTNRCILNVEDFLLENHHKDLPYCRMSLDLSMLGRPSTPFTRGTEDKPAEPQGDPGFSILIKDTINFDECWPVINAMGKSRNIMRPSGYRGPSFDEDDLRGVLSMPVEILCRGIATSLLEGPNEPPSFMWTEKVG